MQYIDDFPLVSIALCTYNGAPYLRRQLDTLVSQTYPNIEIVVNDDGSVDETLQILADYAAVNNRLHFERNTENLGYIKNFENVIQRCKGHYIALADQDDIWELHKIETLIKHIADGVLIYHDSEFVNNKEESLGRMSDIINMYSGNNPLAFLFYNSVSGHSCLFKRDLIAHLGKFPPNYPHDWWLSFIAANHGKVIYFETALVKYRQHEATVTDMLRIREQPRKIIRKFGEMDLQWLSYCAVVNGKFQETISGIITYHQSKKPVHHLLLLYLLTRHAEVLFFIKKKGYFSILNYVRKIAFHQPGNFVIDH
jgi:glycosyltransferase involved in cell wall biosynthesis